MTSIERCPSCGRPIHVYHRTITAPMAAALMAVYVRGNDTWVHIPTFKMLFNAVKVRAALAGGDVNKLRFWDLLEQMEGERPDGSNRIGMVRITEQGRAFCRRKLQVPKFADIYLNRLQGLRGPLIDVVGALRNKFDYNELIAMRSTE